MPLILPACFAAIVRFVGSISVFLLTMTDFASAQLLPRRLHDSHTTYREKALTVRRFKHADMRPLLNKLRPQSGFSVAQIGESVEKRSIHQVKFGSGPTPVLLWSQMHGDEATATMALFDMFNFLAAHSDGFDDVREQLRSKLTIYAVPMLNPDGAERWQRRNALGIDINRDALRLQSPESRLLKQLQQTLQPLVGFNLHDQSPRYSVGKTGKQATLSFLATAFDAGRNMNPVRLRSMQLIAGMNRALQPFIPGRIGRYDDEFEPRAFGDNIQKWGTTLVLIESGGYLGDPEKQYIRQLNFVAMLTALLAIADESYKAEKPEDYMAIPENGRPLFDLLIRNATVERDGQPVRVDVGINRNEVNQDGDKRGDARRFSYKSTVEDLGDLSTFHGLAELDATGLTLTSARVYADTLDTPDALNALDLPVLREQGIVLFRVRGAKSGYVPSQPVHLLSATTRPADALRLGQTPTFLLWKSTKLMHIVVNGFLVGSDSKQTGSTHGYSE